MSFATKRATKKKRVAKQQAASAPKKQFKKQNSLMDLKYKSKPAMPLTQFKQYTYQQACSLVTGTGVTDYSAWTTFYLNRLYDPDLTNASNGKNHAVDYWGILLGTNSGQYNGYIVTSVEYDITVRVQTADKNALCVIHASKATAPTALYYVTDVAGWPMSEMKEITSNASLHPARFHGIVHLNDIYETTRDEWKSNTGFRVTSAGTPTFPAYLHIGIGAAAGDTYTSGWTANLDVKFKFNVILTDPVYRF